MSNSVKAALLHRVGRRGAFLAFLAFLSFVYTWALLPGPPIEHVLGAHIIWTIAWAITGMFCAAGTFFRKDRVPYTVAAAMQATFAMQYAYLWTTRGLPHGFVEVSFWGVLALITLMVSSWPDTTERHG